MSNNEFERLSKSDIKRLLGKLDDKLADRGQKCEILVLGGAALILEWNIRDLTQDVDALFSDGELVRSLREEIAREEGLSDEWLNDGVKGYVDTEPEDKKILYAGDALSVYRPPAKYLLAMKAQAARIGAEESDKEDLKFLIKHCGIESADEVIDIVEKYYPKRSIETKTKFFVESLFEEIQEEKLD